MPKEKTPSPGRGAGGKGGKIKFAAAGKVPSPQASKEANEDVLSAPPPTTGGGGTDGGVGPDAKSPPPPAPTSTQDDPKNATSQFLFYESGQDFNGQYYSESGGSSASGSGSYSASGSGSGDSRGQYASMIDSASSKSVSSASYIAGRSGSSSSGSRSRSGSSRSRSGSGSYSSSSSSGASSSSGSSRRRSRRKKGTKKRGSSGSSSSGSPRDSGRTGEERGRRADGTPSKTFSRNEDDGSKTSPSLQNHAHVHHHTVDPWGFGEDPAYAYDEFYEQARIEARAEEKVSRFQNRRGSTDTTLSELLGDYPDLQTLVDMIPAFSSSDDDFGGGSSFAPGFPRKDQEELVAARLTMADTYRLIKVLQKKLLGSMKELDQLRKENKELDKFRKRAAMAEVLQEKNAHLQTLLDSAGRKPEESMINELRASQHKNELLRADLDRTTTELVQIRSKNSQNEERLKINEKELGRLHSIINDQTAKLGDYGDEASLKRKDQMIDALSEEKDRLLLLIDGERKRHTEEKEKAIKGAVAARDEEHQQVQFDKEHVMDSALSRAAQQQQAEPVVVVSPGGTERRVEIPKGPGQGAANIVAQKIAAKGQTDFVKEHGELGHMLSELLDHRNTVLQKEQDLRTNADMLGKDKEVFLQVGQVVVGGGVDKEVLLQAGQGGVFAGGGVGRRGSTRTTCWARTKRLKGVVSQHPPLTSLFVNKSCLV